MLLTNEPRNSDHEGEGIPRSPRLEKRRTFRIPAPGVHVSDRRSQPVVAAAATGLAIWLAVGCGPEPSGPLRPEAGATTGSLVATIVTAGADLDPTGYLLSVDSGTAQPVSVNGSFIVPTLAVGSHSVLLGGNAANCAIAGANPRPVSIQAGDTARVGFSVTCVANAATLVVKVSTTGTDVDADGYSVRVDTGVGRPVTINGAVTISGLYAGNYFVSLDGVAANCTAVPKSPAAVTVYSGVTTELSFGVTCVRTSGTSGEIAFTSDRDGTEGIYVMPADGSNPIRLSSDLTDDREPAWSPDGNKIAFTSRRDGNDEIYVMNADGSNPMRLTNSGSFKEDPAWSPDGTRIAFESNQSGQVQIYVMDADGSNLSRLTDSGYNEYPAWSPDGTRIAFASDRDGALEIYLMNADGSNQTRLTDGGGGYGDFLPAWSPDGTRIAFVSGRDPDFARGIYIMNADGSALVRFSSSSLDNTAMELNGPAWSPDGKQMAFVVVYGCPQFGCPPPLNYLALMNVDGTGDALIIAPTGDVGYRPAWGPAK